MATNIQGVDPEVHAAIERIVSRFFRLQKGTSVRQLRTSLLEKRNALGELLSTGYLSIIGEEYFPTFKLVDEISPDLSRLAFGQVDAVLAALRNLYIYHEKKNEFSLGEIIEAVRVLAPGLDSNDVVPGLFLAKDFGYFAGWSSPPSTDGQIGFAVVQLTENILDFRSAKETWARISDIQSRFVATAPVSYEPPAEPNPEALPVDFSFVADDKLRRIIERDYSELQGMSTTATKSRIVLAGGLIEALLLDRLLLRGPDALSAKSAERDKKSGEVKPLDEWHLSWLIDVARELEIISEDAKRHSTTIREYRNLVHPGLERRAAIAVREHVANIGEEVLEMVIADIRF